MLEMLEKMNSSDAVKDLIATLMGKEYKKPSKKKRKMYVDDEDYENMEDSPEEMEEEFEAEGDESKMMKEEKMGEDSEMEVEEEKKPKRKKRLGFSMLMMSGKGKPSDGSREK